MPPDMTGRRVMITGASGGIGFEAAKKLARAGAIIAMVARDRRRGEAARDAVVEAAGGDRVELYLCDFQDLDAVRALARAYAQEHDALDVLVNNAGAIYRQRELTPQGFERTWQVNHLAAFLLTNLLEELLVAAAPSRVVTVSSDAHLRAWRGIAFDDPGLPRGWSPFKAYAQSKLANIMFAYELARRSRTHGVLSTAMHPGPVASGFGREGWGPSGRLWDAGRSFMLTPEQGADSIVWLTSSPDVEGRTGLYFYRREAKHSAPPSYDLAAQRRLWELSARQTALAGEER